MEEHPFPDLKISPSEFLDEIESRQLCSVCSKSRRYFCYTCFKALPSIADRIPRIELPFNIHVIKHPFEVSGKSTAVHAAILAPGHVTVYQYPDIPDYCDENHTVLVFPGPNAVSLQQFVLQNASEAQTSEVTAANDSGSTRGAVLNTVVFIDSTWYQVYKIATDPRLTKLQRVELSSHETRFWRHQLDKPRTYLSTIEAMYYCAREYHELCASHGLLGSYNGQYDDLLFFFTYFYRKIHALVVDNGKTLKAYHGQRKKAPKSIKF